MKMPNPWSVAKPLLFLPLALLLLISTTAGAAVPTWVDRGDPAATRLPAADSYQPPLVISAVAGHSFGANAAVLSWSTNEPSDSRVEYGPTAVYGYMNSLDANMVSAHSVTIAGLEASSVYHFRVFSRDAAGHLVTSLDGVFTTDPDTTPPVISAITVDRITDHTAVVSWPTALEISDTQVEYGLTAAYGIRTALAPDLTGLHVVQVGGLIAGATYHYRVLSRDQVGNPASSADGSFTTSTSGGSVSASGSQTSVVAASHPKPFHRGCGSGSAAALVAMALMLLGARLGAR